MEGKNVKFECDNEAVVSVVRSRKTRDKVLAANARNINMLTALFDIEITIVHLPGQANAIADLLSRWDTILNNFQQLYLHIGEPQWIPVNPEMLYIDWTI